jgi:hypothetical protein
VICLDKGRQWKSTNGTVTAVWEIVRNLNHRNCGVAPIRTDRDWC